ncbi:hypothetical protein L1887_29122 [Cichorium endivia]|nr:hypothetical protein L1887_29122 [Cichorium endivia]
MDLMVLYFVHIFILLLAIILQHDQAYKLSTTSSFFHVLFCRSPTTSRNRAKMLYATSKDRLRHELDGVHYEIQATDL